MNVQEILADIKSLRDNNNKWLNDPPDWARAKGLEIGVPPSNYKVIEETLIAIISQQEQDKIILSKRFKEVSSSVADNTLKLVDGTVEIAKSTGAKVSNLFSRLRKSPVEVNTTEQNIVKTTEPTTETTTNA